MNKTIRAAGIFILIFLTISCGEEPVNIYPPLIDPSDELPSLDTVSLQYNLLFDLKFGRNDTFLKRGSEFIFYEGTYCTFLKYNVNSKTWEGNFNYNLPENDYSNKNIFNSSDSVIILAGGTTTGRYSLMSLKHGDLTMKYLIKNSQYEGNLFYSTSTVYENKLIVLLHSIKKIMVIDLRTLSHSYISSYLPVNSGDTYYYRVLSGRRNDCLYLYIGRLGRFFRMDLKTYQSEEISIPAYISKRIDSFERGGLAGNLFCLWLRDSYYTFCYDVDNNKWLNAGKSPFGQFPTISDLRYSSEDALYINGVLNNSMLEIKKTSSLGRGF